MSTLTPPLASVASRALAVPCVDGRILPYANLDVAASAPSLDVVADAVRSLLPWYASVHRGAGFASRVCTELLEGARASVAAFVGARADDEVIFTRNTTDALNLLASAVPRDATVISFRSEHHANLLPWRRARLRGVTHVELSIPTSHDEVLARVDAALACATTPHRLVSVTGASNVTGELFPLAALGAVARRHGARLAVDAAQLAPHRAIDMTALGIDYLALSGHKLYAPYGAGALVARADWLDAAAPWLAGGGAVRAVHDEGESVHVGSARHEAGTPNVVGALALGAACRALDELGMDAVAAHEARLLARATTGIRAIGVEPLAMFGPASDRIGVVAFSLPDTPHGLVAAVLSAEHAVGVRDGAFCAHPLARALVGERGGAVRASFGVGNGDSDIDRLVAGVAALASRGPRARYRHDGGRWAPANDPRVLPALHPLLASRGDRPRATPKSPSAACAGADAT